MVCLPKQSGQYMPQKGTLSVQFPGNGRYITRCKHSIAGSCHLSIVTCLGPGDWWVLDWDRQIEYYLLLLSILGFIIWKELTLHPFIWAQGGKSVDSYSTRTLASKNACVRMGISMLSLHSTYTFLLPTFIIFAHSLINIRFHCQISSKSCVFLTYNFGHMQTSIYIFFECTLKMYY